MSSYRQMDNTGSISESMRRKYLQAVREPVDIEQDTCGGGGYYSSQSYGNAAEDLEDVYKKRAIRLELELSESRRENAQLQETNIQLKRSETIRSQRLQVIDTERQTQLMKDRDDMMRDMQDMARGNRLLCQENEVLGTKYSNLLEVHNKVLLNEAVVTEITGNGYAALTSLGSAARLSEMYTSKMESQSSRHLKPIDKSEEFYTLTNSMESNKRQMNEQYAAFKGKIMKLQTDSHLNGDTKESWRAFAEDLQDTFDRFYRLSSTQGDLTSKVIQNLSGKNRELTEKNEIIQQKLLNNQKLWESKTAASLQSPKGSSTPLSFSKQLAFSPVQTLQTSGSAPATNTQGNAAVDPRQLVNFEDQNPEEGEGEEKVPQFFDANQDLNLKKNPIIPRGGVTTTATDQPKKRQNVNNSQGTGAAQQMQYGTDSQQKKGTAATGEQPTQKHTKWNLLRPAAAAPSQAQQPLKNIQQVASKIAKKQKP